jgi:hypothetical protein
MINGRIDIGQFNTNATPASWVTFDGAGQTTADGLSVNWSGSGPVADHVTLLNTHLRDLNNSVGALIWLVDATNFTARGNEIGPACCQSDGIGIEIRNNGSPSPQNIVIDRNNVHDIYEACSETPSYLGACSGTGYGSGCSSCDHIDGLQAFGGLGVSITNNRFYMNGAHKQGIFLQSANGGSFSNVLIQNNMVNSLSNNDVSISGPGTSVFTGYVKMLYNTFQGEALVYNGVVAPGTPVTIAGNIIQGYAGNTSAGGCTMSYGGGSTLTPTWRNNLLGSNPPCGTGDKTGNATFLRPSWPSGGVPDLHLSGSQAAINAGEATYCPSPDIDGQPRPQGTACDIGADEAG